MIQSYHSIRKSFYWLLLIGFISTPLLWLQLSNPTAYHGILSDLHQNNWLLRFVRWSCLLLFAISCPIWLKKRVSHPREVHFFREFSRLLIWLILFDLIICENFIGHFFR